MLSFIELTIPPTEGWLAFDKLILTCVVNEKKEWLAGAPAFTATTETFAATRFNKIDICAHC